MNSNPSKSNPSGQTFTDVNPIVERLLTYKQAGELLGVTERTVWTLVDDGELPAVRFGRSVRIDPADLRAYIDRCKTSVKQAGENPGGSTKPIGGE